MKITAITSGGDWADASVQYVVRLKEFDIEEEKKRRDKWYREKYIPELNRGENPTYYDLTEWLIKEGLVREANDGELEEYHDE